MTSTSVEKPSQQNSSPTLVGYFSHLKTRPSPNTVFYNAPYPTNPKKSGKGVKQNPKMSKTKPTATTNKSREKHTKPMRNVDATDGSSLSFSKKMKNDESRPATTSTNHIPNDNINISFNASTKSSKISKPPEIPKTNHISAKFTAQDQNPLGHIPKSSFKAKSAENESSMNNGDISVVPLVESGKDSIDIDDSIIEQANALKEAGNAAFQKNNFKLAKTKYSEALDLHKTSVLYSNRCAARLKLFEYQGAESDAYQSWKIDPSNVKNLLRLASARLSLKKYNQALDTVEEALVLKPGSSKSQKLKKRIQTALTQAEEERQTEINKLLQTPDIVSSNVNDSSYPSPSQKSNLDGGNVPTIDQPATTMTESLLSNDDTPPSVPHVPANGFEFEQHLTELLGYPKVTFNYLLSIKAKTIPKLYANFFDKTFFKQFVDAITSCNLENLKPKDIFRITLLCAFLVQIPRYHLVNPAKVIKDHPRKEILERLFNLIGEMAESKQITASLEKIETIRKNFYGNT